MQGTDEWVDTHPQSDPYWILYDEAACFKVRVMMTYLSDFDQADL